MICKWAKLLGKFWWALTSLQRSEAAVKAAFSKQPGLWDSISRLAHFRLSHCFEGRGRRPQLFCLQSFVGQLCVRHHGACLWERPMSRLSLFPTCPLMRKGRAWILAHTQAVFKKVVWGSSDPCMMFSFNFRNCLRSPCADEWRAEPPPETLLHGRWEGDPLLCSWHVLRRSFSLPVRLQP